MPLILPLEVVLSVNFDKIVASQWKWNSGYNSTFFRPVIRLLCFSDKNYTENNKSNEAQSFIICVCLYS